MFGSENKIEQQNRHNRRFFGRIKVIGKILRKKTMTLDSGNWPGIDALNEKDQESAMKSDIKYARIRQNKLAAGGTPYTDTPAGKNQREFDEVVVEQYGLED